MINNSKHIVLGVVCEGECQPDVFESTTAGEEYSPDDGCTASACDRLHILKS